MKESMFGKFSSATAAISSKSVSSISSLSKKSVNMVAKTMEAGSNVISGEQKKKLREAQERQLQINTVLSILDDVRLQCPVNHSGLVLAYSGANMAPIMHPGIKFSWFRMSGVDSVTQVDESQRSWYAPTADDIGCVMCVQCEDACSEQGLSKYVECGPIKADSLLCSLAETTVDTGSYESKAIFVSLGLEEKSGKVGGGAGQYDVAGAAGGQGVNGGDDLTGEHDDNNSNNNNRNGTAEEVSIPSMMHSSLSTEADAFLQLQGRSTVEIDSHGVFISIPTMQRQEEGSGRKDAAEGANGPGSAGSGSGAAEKKNHGTKSGGETVASRQRNSRDNNKTNSTHSTTSSSSLRNNRRGLRIPASVGLKAHCVQPLYVVLVVPIMQSNSGERVEEEDEDEDSNVSTSKDVTDSSMGEAAGALSPKTKKKNENDQKMQQFLNSSTIAIPWTYEGTEYSPEANYSTSSSGSSGTPISAEVLAAQKAAAEQDAIEFATTVSSLAEFVSSVPEGTSELRVCFSCPDRLTRDGLVLAIRSLACTSSTSTRAQKVGTFPWVASALAEGLDNPLALVADTSSDPSADIDTKRRLKTLEEENISLKKECKELTKQLLGTREELARVIKSSSSSSSSSYANTAEGAGGVASSSRADSGDGGGRSSTAGRDPTVMLATGDVGLRIIELENKIAIANQKEAEHTKLTAELEARNEKLFKEMEKYKKNNEDVHSRLVVVQSMCDKQQVTITKLEDSREESRREVEISRAKLRELDVLQATIQGLQLQVVQAKQLHENAVLAADVDRSSIDLLTKKLEKAEREAAVQARQDAESITKMQSLVDTATAESLQLKKEVAEQKEHIFDLTALVDASKKMEAELLTAESRASQLSGELNHLLRKSESQTRDLKKNLKDSSMALAEFEKALMRKSEECNELYQKIADMEATAKAAAEKRRGSLFEKMRTVSSAIGQSGNSGSSNGSGGGRERRESTASTVSTSDS